MKHQMQDEKQNVLVNPKYPPIRKRKMRLVCSVPIANMTCVIKVQVTLIASAGMCWIFA